MPFVDVVIGPAFGAAQGNCNEHGLIDERD